jgi:hypothetical protein
VTGASMRSSVPPLWSKPSDPEHDAVIERRARFTTSSATGLSPPLGPRKPW